MLLSGRTIQNVVRPVSGPYVPRPLQINLFVIITGTSSVNDSRQQILTSDTQRHLTQRESKSPGINTTVCLNPGIGYWTGVIWNSASCLTKQWTSRSEIGECIRNKSLFFLGDSTTRQWVVTLLKLLGEQEVERFIAGQRCIGYFKEYNFNLTFQFHPQRIGSSSIPVDDEIFEVEILDSLRDPKCNYVVTVSPWAHYAQWWLPAYKERLKLIRKAIQRLKQHCPDAVVIVKSPHVRNDDGVRPESLLMYSDFIFYQMKTIMEEVLNIDGVYYIDVWNMNLAYPAKKVVHMPDEVVRQELNLFLPHICPG